MSEAKSRSTKPELVELLLNIFPEYTERILDYLQDRLELSDAAQLGQDPVTTGLWNMPSVAGINGPPKVPPVGIVARRRSILRFIDYLREIKGRQSLLCKHRIEKIVTPNGDGNELESTRIVIEDPKNAMQKLATDRVKRIDKWLSELINVDVKPLSDAILEYRLKPILDKIVGGEFLGKGEGQKHVGAHEDFFKALEARGHLTRNRSRNPKQ